MGRCFHHGKAFDDTLKNNYSSARINIIREFDSSGSPGMENRDEWTDEQHQAYKDFKVNPVNVTIHQFMVNVEKCNEHAESHTANDCDEVLSYLFNTDIE